MLRFADINIKGLDLQALTHLQELKSIDISNSDVPLSLLAELPKLEKLRVATIPTESLGLLPDLKILLLAKPQKLELLASAITGLEPLGWVVRLTGEGSEQLLTGFAKAEASENSAIAEEAHLNF